MSMTFEESYERWYPDVVRSAWRICHDVPHAEELAQEAFVRAYRRWRKLERDGYAEPWLHRVAMNLAITAVKRRQRGRRLEAEQGVMFAPPVEARDDEWLVDTLERLPRRHREAVFLRVIADLSEEDVAAVMGCSNGSVKVHKKRGLDRLRELMEAREETVDAVG